MTKAEELEKQLTQCVNYLTMTVPKLEDANKYLLESIDGELEQAKSTLKEYESLEPNSPLAKALGTLINQYENMFTVSAYGHGYVPKSVRDSIDPKMPKHIDDFGTYFK